MEYNAKKAAQSTTTWNFEAANSAGKFATTMSNVSKSVRDNVSRVATAFKNLATQAVQATSSRVTKGIQGISTAFSTAFYKNISK